MEKTIRLAAASLVAFALAGCGANTAEEIRGGSSASRAQENITVPPADNERLGAGAQFSVGLAMDGQVYAWGENNYGQLGNGTLERSLVPHTVPGLSGVRAVSAGAFHVLATKQDGSLWGWGSNHMQQLAAGPSNGHTVPLPVAGLSQVRTVSANAYHNVALTRDGGVYAWGRMAGVTRRVPSPIQGLSGARAVSAGYDFALALKPDGTVWGWGSNMSNELAQPRNVPVAGEPVQIEGIDKVVAIVTGHYHSLALREDGSIWGWGSNYYSQVGKGSGNRPARIEGLPDTGAREVKGMAASPSNSAVLYSDGSVWAWGRNFHGQLGIHAGNVVRAPVRLALPGEAVALAMSYDTILVLNKDGSVYGIGLNTSGQLGNNTTVSTNTPVQVAGAAGNGYLNLGKSASGN